MSRKAELTDAIRERIKEIYYDPETGFVSAQSIYEKMKKEVPLRLIKEVLGEQEVVQVHKPIKRDVSLFYPISGEAGSYQADLFFYDSLKRDNAGYTGGLIIIEITSRMLYAYPLKKKNADEVLETFKAWLPTAKWVPAAIGTDSGTEFLNSKMKRWMDENDIEHIIAETGDKTKQGMVERSIRTLRERIEKYMTAEDTETWYDVLPKIIANYNSTVHSSTGYAPKLVDLAIAKEIRGKAVLKQMAVRRKLQEFKEDENVRAVVKKDAFAKGAEAKWQKGTPKIEDIEGPTFRLRSSAGNLLTAPYRLYHIRKSGKIDERTRIEPEEKPRAPQLERRKIAKRVRASENLLNREGIQQSNVVGARRTRATSLSEKAAAYYAGL
jgi:hypothetical protein